MDPSPTQVLTLFACTPQAKKVLYHEHNSSMVQMKNGHRSNVNDEDHDEESGPTRENTHESEELSAFRLRLDRPPKDRSLGWVFGRRKACCDVILPGRSTSNKHFRIHFNEETGIVLISDTSLNGTFFRDKLLHRSTEVLFDHSA